jgi:hypothetical protein
MISQATASFSSRSLLSVMGYEHKEHMITAKLEVGE